MKILSILLFLVGCGSDEYISSQLNQEHEHQKVLQLNEFAKYIDMFERDSATYGDGIIITDLIIGLGIVNPPNNDNKDGEITLGECTTAPNRTPEIVISIEYWDRLTAIRKKMLIYHELGHCVLDRDHTPNAGEESGYDSIMNRKLPKTVTIEQNLLYFIRELFQP